MGIRHIPDGQDFQYDESFGFHGSAQKHATPRGRRPTTTAPNTEPNEPPVIENTHEDDSMNVDHGNSYAHGGHVHPHGHSVVRVEHHHDGRVVHHHEHGGHTVHHADGRVTHHMHDGSPAEYGTGGQMMAPEPMAHSPVMTHPHGHRVTHVEGMADGGEVHHHEHGGHSMHHADGRVTHHDHSGAMVDHRAGGSAGTYARGGPAGRPTAGDQAADKRLVAKGIRQHEDHEHGGEHTDLELARGGGIPGMKARLPRGMMPKAARSHSPIGSGRSPIERPPRNPAMTTSPRNTYSGGEMGYGVEPSAEPDTAGSEQGIPQLRGGGRAKRGRE